MLWDNTTRFVFTLAAAVVGLVAYILTPSRTQVDHKLTAFYERKGKWALFIIAFLTLGLAGVLSWEFFRYGVQNVWVGINLGIFATMGVAILAGNMITMRAVRHTAEHVEIVEPELVEVTGAEGAPAGPSSGDAVIDRDQPPSDPPPG